MKKIMNKVIKNKMNNKISKNNKILNNIQI